MSGLAITLYNDNNNAYYNFLSDIVNYLLTDN